LSKEARVSENNTRCNGPDPLDQIRSLYTELALRPDQDFGWSKGSDNARQLGYDEVWLARLPAMVWESAAAVGNPFQCGPIVPGETVVDLGCGAGADACVAALLTGPTGKVHGFDATPAMIAKATANAMAAGLANLEFHEADMTALRLADGVADVVISNGAINLARDKAAVFAEVHRILRRSGRFQFADMVREPGGDACCATEGSWADCVSGTLAAEEVERLLRAAGFDSIERVGFTGYRTSAATIGALFRARKP
jgi:SAM-dependent methyltransferase